MARSLTIVNQSLLERHEPIDRLIALLELLTFAEAQDVHRRGVPWQDHTSLSEGVLFLWLHWRVDCNLNLR